MNSKVKLLGYYNYTVILTYIGMLFGFTGIVLVMEKEFFLSLICLMLSGVCDMFDGAIAQTRKRTSEEKCFGIQIDSLSDLICFGVFPAVYVYMLNEGSSVAFLAAGFYVLSALVRLAFFNVDEQERQNKTEERRKTYLGLPVTMSALFLPIVWEVSGLGGISSKLPCMITLFVMGILFLLPIPLKKPNIIGKICMILCGLAEFFFLFAGIGDV